MNYQNFVRILSDNIAWPQRTCLTFWYHMYGHFIASLNVYLKVSKTSQNIEHKRKWNFNLSIEHIKLQKIANAYMNSWSNYITHTMAKKASMYIHRRLHYRTRCKKIAYAHRNRQSYRGTHKKQNRERTYVKKRRSYYRAYKSKTEAYSYRNRKSHLKSSIWL